MMHEVHAQGRDSLDARAIQPGVISITDGSAIGVGAITAAARSCFDGIRQLPVRLLREAKRRPGESEPERAVMVAAVTGGAKVERGAADQAGGEVLVIE